MIANILIAASFFIIGATVGGVLVLHSCWKELEKKSKELQKAQSDPLIIRVYGPKN